MEVRNLSILFIISKMGKGGAQHIVLDLANAMVAGGAKVDLLIFYRTVQDQSVLAELDSRVGLLNILPIALASDHENSPKKIFSFLLLPLLAFWWTVSGRMAKYHIVHSNLMLASFFAWVCSIFQFLSRKPVPKYVETFHSDLVSLLPWERKLFSLFWKTSDSLIVELRRKDFEILRNEMPEHSISYIPFGILPLDLPDQRDINEYKKIYGNTPILLSIMRLHQHQKKVLDLLMVIDQFRKIYSGPFIYLLVGDGPDRQRAQEFVRSAGLDEHVKFTGYVDDIQLLCATARAFLIAGVEDLVGIAGLQAASLGVPIVSLQMDPEWKKNESIFFNSTSHKVLAGELERLVTDDAYYKDAADYAAFTVRSIFSVDRMVASYAHAYISIVTKRID
jgi:glycosyltransferase involved in cell wall biosynthesis